MFSFYYGIGEAFFNNYRDLYIITPSYLVELHSTLLCIYKFLAYALINVSLNEKSINIHSMLSEINNLYGQLYRK